jgi:hypothetical protein
MRPHIGTLATPQLQTRQATANNATTGIGYIHDTRQHSTNRTCRRHVRTGLLCAEGVQTYTTGNTSQKARYQPRSKSPKATPYASLQGCRQHSGQKAGLVQLMHPDCRGCENTTARLERWGHLTCP